MRAPLYSRAYNVFCNVFYCKIFCGGILYTIVKFILVGLCVLIGKTFLRRYGKIWCGGGGS